MKFTVPSMEFSMGTKPASTVPAATASRTSGTERNGTNSDATRSACVSKACSVKVPNGPKNPMRFGAVATTGQAMPHSYSSTASFRNGHGMR